MDEGAYRALSPRELECLRQVANGLTSKEIAALLTRQGEGGRTLMAGTVDGYIKSAITKLGAADRRDAARMVAEQEGTAPRWLGEPDAGGRPAPPVPAPAVPAVRRGWTDFPWPWRRPGEVNNDLGIAARLLWIPILCIGLAVGFGSLVSGLKVVADLVGSSHLLTHSDRKRPPNGHACNRLPIGPECGRAPIADR